MDLMSNSSVLFFLMCCFELPNFTKPLLLEVAIALYHFQAKRRRLVSLTVSDRHLTIFLSGCSKKSIWWLDRDGAVQCTYQLDQGEN